MLFRLLLSLSLIFTSIGSSAQLICHGAHNKARVEYKAWFFDNLNKQYNDVVFDRSLQDVLSPDFSQVSRFALIKKYRLRSQAKKLRSLLEDMKDLEKLQAKDKVALYDIREVAKKIDDLAFLSDPSVTKKMTKEEKRQYHQWRHSVLTHGLKRFLFEGSSVSEETQKSIWQRLRPHLKARYAWFLLRVPHMKEDLIPEELCMDVAWNGLQANQMKLAKYRNSRMQSLGNVFITMWNVGLLTALFVGVPLGTYGYTAYKNAEMQGHETVVKFLNPALKQSSEMAKADYRIQGDDMFVENFKKDFHADHGREPTAEEIKMAVLLVQANDAVAATAPAAPVGNGMPELRSSDFTPAAPATNGPQKTEPVHSTSAPSPHSSLNRQVEWVSAANIEASQQRAVQAQPPVVETIAAPAQQPQPQPAQQPAQTQNSMEWTQVSPDESSKQPTRIFKKVEPTSCSLNATSQQCNP